MFQMLLSEIEARDLRIRELKQKGFDIIAMDHPSSKAVEVTLSYSKVVYR